jgi:hypothetical protein
MTADHADIAVQPARAPATQQLQPWVRPEDSGMARVVLGLQQQAGNRAVQRLVAPRMVQRTLTDDLNEMLDKWSRDSAAILTAINNAPPDQRHAALADARLVRRLQDKLSRTDALAALQGLGAPLNTRLTLALSGTWGADSAAALSMIQGAPQTERDAVLGDRQLMAKLESRLSRTDALTALEGLGAPLNVRLDEAMRGWGVDSAAILRMAQAATAEQRTAVLRDRPLINRLKASLSRTDMLQLLAQLGAPLNDRFSAALDGWGIDSQAILDLAGGASATDRRLVLDDAALMTRLGSSLGRDELAVVLQRLGASLSDRVYAALQGWSADSQAIMSMLQQASQADREQLKDDVQLVAKLRSGLNALDYEAARTLIGLPKEPPVGAVPADVGAGGEAAQGGPAQPAAPTLVHTVSEALEQHPPDAAAILSAVQAAPDDQRSALRSSSALMTQIRALDGPGAGQLQVLLGDSIVNRIDLLLTTAASHDAVLAALTGATADERRTIIENRAVMARLLAYLGEDGDKAMGTLNDSLINRLTALCQGTGTQVQIFALITTATPEDRALVEHDDTVLNVLHRKLGAYPYWKSRLLLQYGTEAAIPAQVAGLYTSLQDVKPFADVRRIVANLSDADLDVVKTDRGIREYFRALGYGSAQQDTLLRMLDQGLITEETGVGHAFSEQILTGGGAAPFTVNSFSGNGKYDITYYRDRLQVDVPIKLHAVDDHAKTLIDGAKATWLANIESEWNSFQIHNPMHTLNLKFHPIFGSSGYHDVAVHSGNPVWPGLNAANWYCPEAGVNDTAYTGYSGVHEFGHLLGLPDEYQQSSAHYLAVVGSDPTTDPNARDEGADSTGAHSWTNINSVMGGVGTRSIGGTVYNNVPGPVLQRHLTDFLKWINTNRRKAADGSFAEPEFAF